MWRMSHCRFRLSVEHSEPTRPWQESDWVGSTVCGQRLQTLHSPEIITAATLGAGGARRFAGGRVGFYVDAVVTKKWASMPANRPLLPREFYSGWIVSGDLGTYGWMGRSRTKRAAVGCLALLLQLAAGFEAPLDLNLCIAEDGHTVLELAHAEGACIREVERHHREWEALDFGGIAHHPCRDLNLSSSECGPASSEPRIGSLAMVVSVSTDDVLSLVATRFSHLAAGAHAAAVLQRGTVVLLV